MPSSGEHPLELADVPGTARPHLLGRETEDAHGDHVLVVGAVEDTDRAARREHRVDAPQVVVLEFPRRPGP